MGNYIINVDRNGNVRDIRQLHRGDFFYYLGQLYQLLEDPRTIDGKVKVFNETHSGLQELCKTIEVVPVPVTITVDSNWLEEYDGTY